MKKSLLFIFYCLFCCGLCAEKYYITLDVLRPGDITFSANVAHLLLVNNTVPQPHGFGHTINVDGNNSFVEQNTDSLPLFCLASMHENLENLGFFTSVSMLPISTNNSGTFYALSRLTTKMVDSLCVTYGVDAVLALNRIVVTDQLSCIYDEYQGNWESALDVFSVSSWSLHYPRSSEIINKNYADTLSWQASDVNLQSAYDQLPDRGDAEVDVALQAGGQSVKRILPSWGRVERYFYTNNNTQIIQGFDSIPYQKWEAALAIWNGLHEDKSTVTQAYAAANVAVIYELKGDYAQAIHWVEKACALATSPLSSRLRGSFLQEQQIYLRQLQQRVKDEELLRQQL